MKILIINTYDKGGAANACLRLHEGLLNEHIDSKVLLKHRTKGLPQTFRFEKKSLRKSKLQRVKEKGIRFLRGLDVLKKPAPSQAVKFNNQRPVGLELFSFPQSEFDITTSPLYHEADIINLHWVADFLDYESFFIKNTKPVVWTLHDMNPFTGGEHYLETFLGMHESGFPIRRTVSDEEMLISKANLTLKSLAMQATSNVTIVAPSQWLAQEAERSTVFNSKKVYCIPYGLNTEVYQPRDKNHSRDILNIPKNKTVILFVTDAIDKTRKGYVFLKKALEILKRDDVVLCAIGYKNSALEAVNNTIELGAINDEEMMSIAYSAADVFVIPSLMDNLPNTVLESLLCGTPVIGFPVGGIKDMIQHGENGLLTNEISVNALLETIQVFINSKPSFNRETIRERAVNKYDLKIQADRYIKLYKQILNQDK